MDFRVPLIGLLFSTGAAAAEEYSGSRNVDWTGAYVGAHAGSATGNGKTTLDGYYGALATSDVAKGIFPREMEARKWGVTGGVHAGFNWQSGNIVTGAEADIGYAALDGIQGLDVTDMDPASVFFGANTVTSYRTSFGALATARLRGGYAIDNMLVYATAGVAVGKVENHFKLAIPAVGYSSPGWSSDAVRAGYAIGGGIEHKLTDRIALRLELMRIDLGDTVITASDPAAFPGESISYRFDNSLLVAYGGLNWYF